MQTYKTIYTVLSFAVVPMIAYWGYMSIRYYKKFVYSKVMLALALSCAFYILVWNICEITRAAYLDSVALVIMPAYIVTVLALILIDFHELRMDVAVSNRRLSNAYKKSIIDGLTKLYNAEYMKKVTRDTSPPFAFAVYDVDDFKKANDTYGHPAGDEVLIKISDEISKMLRKGDVLGRYGGDEFILLLKANSIESVKSILERIRKTVEDFEIQIEGCLLKATISIGFYMVDEKQEYKSMLLKADRALYQAKNEGKNKIVLYNEFEDNSCPPELIK
jgi:diguanylate cyclase (GGDEF)-like protein